MRPLLPFALALLLALPAAAQQAADPEAEFAVARPAFAAGAGPRLVIDGGHHNFHKVDGRYAPFAAVVRADGFQVAGSEGRLTAEGLAGVKVLVIANALHASNVGGDNWVLPNPSAFSREEIAAVKAWVEAGGGLLLIADHMPFAGAAQELAQAFGFSFSNGFVQREAKGPDLFTPESGLKADIVTAGRDASETVTSIRTFTGSAFTAPAGARPLIVLSRGYVSKEPRVAWAFDKDTTVIDAEGRLQAAVMPYGRGRVAVFGEAAMFSAQLSGPEKTPIGFNAPDAVDNRKLLLNVVRWLAGVLPAA
ncbi:MAG TPA: DUF4350 domain-containing protein [Caulobacter sp.]|nr:DUF4350 domain-containing protein [Caulobacter sp.]